MLASLLLSLAAAGPSLDGLAAVRSVLQRAEGASTCPEDVLVRRLTALGSEAAPALFALVTGEAVDELLGESEADAWLCEPDRVGALALDTLGNLPERAVHDCLRARLAGETPRGVRVAALDVLARLRASAGVGLWFELVAQSAEELEMRAVRQPAVAALSAMLAADSQTARALEAPLLAAGVAEQRLACEALAACGRGEAAPLLRKLVGRDPELDLAVLEALAALAERYPWRLSEDTAALLRACVEHQSPRLHAAAARALGRLRDVKSVAALISRLDSADPDVLAAVRWALRETTGEKRLATGEEWRAWLEAERAWWLHEGKERVETFAADGDAGALAETLRLARVHPLARAPLADALLARLDSLEPGAQAIACTGLAALHARAAVPSLVELLFSTDASVRAAAWSALRQLTGEDLPAEPRLWEEFAFG